MPEETKGPDSVLPQPEGAKAPAETAFPSTQPVAPAAESKPAEAAKPVAAAKPRRSRCCKAASCSGQTCRAGSGAVGLGVRCAIATTIRVSDSRSLEIPGADLHGGRSVDPAGNPAAHARRRGFRLLC